MPLHGRTWMCVRQGRTLPVGRHPLQTVAHAVKSEQTLVCFVACSLCKILIISNRHSAFHISILYLIISQNILEQERTLMGTLCYGYFQNIYPVEGLTVPPKGGESCPEQSLFSSTARFMDICAPHSRGVSTKPNLWAEGVVKACKPRLETHSRRIR